MKKLRRLRELFWATCLALLACWAIDQIVQLHERRMHPVAERQQPIRIELTSMPSVYFREGR